MVAYISELLNYTGIAETAECHLERMRGLVFTWAEWGTGLRLMKIWSWQNPLVLIDGITCMGSWALFPKEMP